MSDLKSHAELSYEMCKISYMIPRIDKLLLAISARATVQLKDETCSGMAAEARDVLDLLRLTIDAMAYRHAIETRFRELNLDSK